MNGNVVNENMKYFVVLELKHGLWFEYCNVDCNGNYMVLMVGKMKLIWNDFKG